MLESTRRQLGESLQAFRAVFTNANLRRVELAWIGSETGKWLYLIALYVYAYEAGGAGAVGLVALVRTVAAAAAAPFTALLGDRFPRERVMLYATLLRAVGMAAAAGAVLLDSPAALVYALATVVTLLSTAFRPAQAALLPSLARTPQELTAANVASSTITSIGGFAGAALGGLLLAATSTEVVFATTAVLFGLAAALVSRITGVEERPHEGHVERASVAREALAGFRVISGNPELRLINALYAAQTLVAGALTVLVVVAAIELLELGESGVGFLNAAFGVGGLVGALGALGLIAGARLATGFTVGLLLWGAPLALVGLLPEPALALFLLALMGIGDTLVDVAGLTLLQRAVPDDVLARVFGALESLQVGAMGLGAVLAPILISLLGVRGALVVIGAILPVLALLSARKLARIDAASRAPARQLTLLRGVPIFAPLPPAVLEPLAGRLTPLVIPAGEVVFRQGDQGDRFYVIAAGEAVVSVDGAPARGLAEGDYFGEIALLRAMPRTATVAARTQLELYALERDDFVAAVTGFAPSLEAAESVIGTRLATGRVSAAYE
ncbi:MAG: MFS transporter [Actinobacteria bacterium]|nr:MFS transporter [Actinomycetota bacterium]